MTFHIASPFFNLVLDVFSIPFALCCFCLGSKTFWSHVIILPFPVVGYFPFTLYSVFLSSRFGFHLLPRSNSNFWRRRSNPCTFVASPLLTLSCSIRLLCESWITPYPLSTWLSADHFFFRWFLDIGVIVPMPFLIDCLSPRFFSPADPFELKSLGLSRSREGEMPPAGSLCSCTAPCFDLESRRLILWQFRWLPLSPPEDFMTTAKRKHL